MNIAQHPRRIARIAVVAAVAAAVLSGCAPESSEHGASHSPNPSSSASVSASPEPSKDPAVAAEATPVGVTCDDIITAQNLYDFNPNYSRIDAPASVTATAQEAIDLKGIACYYVNQTSGEVITVTVATPGPTKLASLRTDLTATATPAPQLGDAWFADGQATVLAGSTYWITVSSDAFYEGVDAQQLVTYVTSHLG